MNRAFLILFIFITGFANAQTAKYTLADTLKGSITAQRSWWDVTHYDIHATFSALDSSIKGLNKISYKIISAYPYTLEKEHENFSSMQIDLLEPMEVDSVKQDGKKCEWTGT